MFTKTFTIFPLSVFNKQNRNLFSITPPLERWAMKECQHFTNYKAGINENITWIIDASNSWKLNSFLSRFGPKNIEPVKRSKEKRLNTYTTRSLILFLGILSKNNSFTHQQESRHRQRHVNVAMQTPTQNLIV